jgi:MarR family transcriptional regulator for hemolysin
MSTELAKLLDVGKVTIGGLIDRLEAAGYVYRRGDKVDRRAKRIFITDTGYALIERMKSILLPLNDSLSVGLTAEDIAVTERNLSMIRDNIRALLIEDPGVSEDPAEHVS